MVTHENKRPEVAHDPFWIHEEVKAAVYNFVCEGAVYVGPLKDLRGMTFSVTVSSDGSTIEVEEN